MPLANRSTPDHNITSSLSLPIAAGHAPPTRCGISRAAAAALSARLGGAAAVHAGGTVPSSAASLRSGAQDHWVVPAAPRGT